MPTPQRPTTTQRGYGYRHQLARAAALRNLTPGEPCAFCGAPMFIDQQLDYDHETAMVLGGRATGPRRLTHSECNRSAGGRLKGRSAGERHKGRTRTYIAPPITSRKW
jgi:hypothetical protein